MWLGGAAGLALLTLPFARLAHAQNISVSDQQLLYDGQGWGTFVAPQECAGISGTVHSTSSSGDTVSYSFTGNAVYVYGPSTSASPPMTVVFDNAVQPMAPVTQDGSGCGILYSNSNIPDNGGEHLLVMMYTNPSDSGFSVSGIMLSNSDSNNSLPPVQAAPVAPSTVPVPTTPASVPTNSPTTSISPSLAPTTTDPSGASANAAGMDPSNNSTAPSTSSGADPTSSVIETSEFVTTPGMTVGVIGAILGAVLGMITLLVLFLFIRRRIARKGVLQTNQKSIMKTGRERDMEEGKRQVPFADDALSPAWRSKDIAAPSAGGWNADGSNIDVSGPAVPAAAASSPSRTAARSRSARSTYTVNLAPAFLNEPPPPRAIPASLTLSPNDPHSPTPPRLGTGGSSGLSQSSGPPPFSSSAATWGGDPDEKTQGAHVVNRTDSNRSASTARTGPPPPGYI